MGSRKPLIGTRQVQYSLTCLRIPLQARLQFSPHSQSLHGFRNSKGRPEAALHLCGTPPSGAAPAIPFGGWIAVFAKIRSPAQSAASSGLWRQPTLFGIHIVPVALTGQLSSLRLETSNDGEGKKSLPRAMIFVRAARVFDRGPIRVMWRRGQPFRLIPGAARSRHRRAF